MKVMKAEGGWGTYSWVDGFKPGFKKLSLEEEARKNPQAVIFRLLNKGEEELAEYFFNKYVADAA